MTLPEEIKADCRCARFGDDDCGYRGPAKWCDRTFTNCSLLGNQERFNMRQPPIKQPHALNWRVIASIILSVGTAIYVNDWSTALLLYIVSCVLYLPHFWGSSGAIASLRAMLSPEHVDVESASASETKDSNE